MEWPSEILQKPYSGIRIDDSEFEMLILVFIQATRGWLKANTGWLFKKMKMEW